MRRGHNVTFTDEVLYPLLAATCAAFLVAGAILLWALLKDRNRV